MPVKKTVKKAVKKTVAKGSGRKQNICEGKENGLRKK